MIAFPSAPEIFLAAPARVMYNFPVYPRERRRGAAGYPPAERRSCGCHSWRRRVKRAGRAAAGRASRAFSF